MLRILNAQNKLGAELFDVTFTVTAGGTPVENARIVIDGEEKFTNALGVAVFRLTAGTFTYQITHPSYDTVTDTVVVTGNQAVDLNVLSEKKAGLMVRYSAPSLAGSVLNSFTDYGKSFTALITSFSSPMSGVNLNQYRTLSESVDLGVWSGNSAYFRIFGNLTERKNLYEGMDALLPVDEKGIWFYWIDGNGNTIVIMNMYFPPLAPAFSSNELLIDFQVATGTSNIITTGMGTTEDYFSIYIDPAKTFASEFHVDLQGKWLKVKRQNDDTFELNANGISDATMSSIWSAFVSNNSFSGANQLKVRKKLWTFPSVSGFKYHMMEMVHAWGLWGFRRIVSIGESEQAGYIQDGNGDGAPYYQILKDLGFKSGGISPFAEMMGVGVMGDNQALKICANSNRRLSTIAASLAEAKYLISNCVARGIHPFERNVAFSGIFTNAADWDEIVGFCATSGIDVIDHSEYADRVNAGYDPDDNIFPRLNKDSIATGTPDGYLPFPANVSLGATGGDEIDGGKYIRWANGATGAVALGFEHATYASQEKAGLAGFEIGTNQIVFQIRNDGTATDVVRIEIGSKVLQVGVKSSEWQTKTIKFESTSYFESKAEVSIESWSSSGVVDITGIEITGAETDPAPANAFDALIQRMDSFGEHPNEPTLAIYQEFYNSLVAEGLWDAADAIYVPASHGYFSSQRNWKSNNFNLTYTKSSIWQGVTGIKGDGTNYASTNYNISTNASQLSQNSHSLASYSSVNVKAANMGCRTSATHLRAYGGTISILFAGLTAQTAYATATTTGLITTSRTAADLLKGYQGATERYSATTSPGAIFSAPIYLLANARNLSGVISAEGISTDGVMPFVWIGRGLTPDEVSDLNTIVTKLLTDLGAI